MVKKSRLRGGADEDIPTSNASTSNVAVTGNVSATSNVSAPGYPQYVVQYGMMQVPASVMESNGLPWFLAQHPNHLSMNSNEIILYNSAIAFMSSAFYKKYQARMVYVKAVTLYSSMGNKTTQPQEIPAKNYRFVFGSK